MFPGLANWSWLLDGWIVVAGVLCAVSASLLGNFLVLRRTSMLGDAISHAVLPGLAAAFFLTESRSSFAMFLGAVVAGLLTAVFTEWVRGFGRVDEGASMGVVFTSLFALGLVMIVRAADHVDLDPGCVLYGAIELTPLDTWPIGGFDVPRVVVVLAGVLAMNTAFVTVFRKELAITSFDPGLATTVGLNARLVHYLLMTLVAVTAVASFESVGNILVVAMFVVPPAAAYLLTDRLSVMIVLSAVIAACSAVLGHVSAIVVPGWFGFGSVPTAGMMAVAAGVLFLPCILFAPRHGVVVRSIRRRALAWRILSEDVLGLLYRMGERDTHRLPATIDDLRGVLFSGPLATRFVVRRHERSGLVERDGTGYRLTEAGERRAREVVRSHRLWEQYLFHEAGVPAERLHAGAERLEHFTDRELRDRLAEQVATSETDPHGSPIPPEGESGGSPASPKQPRL